jgi:hypothetical protein
VEKGFTNQRDWTTLSLAMTVWLAHFTLLWLASVVFPTHPAARWIAVVFTLVAAGALVLLWRRSDAGSVFTVPGLGIAIASAGTAYGLLPALLS